MSYLYHYTKPSTAIKILESKVFKFGHLQNTNDPFEKLQNRISFNSNPNTKFKHYWDNLCIFFNSELYIACFGTSGGKVRPDEKWTMWAHYGARHSGVCFVFNKEKFEEDVKKLIKDPMSNWISYDLQSFYLDFNDQIITIPFKKFIMDFQRQLFFIKHEDWSCENEFRIVVFSKNFAIPLSNSLKKVIFGPEISSKNKEIIENLFIKNYHSVKYGKLLYSGSGYLKPFSFFPE